jgi:hypothetical protein
VVQIRYKIVHQTIKLGKIIDEGLAISGFLVGNQLFQELRCALLPFMPLLQLIH